MLDANDDPVIYTRFGNMLESDLEKWAGWQINANDVAFVKEHRLKADLEFGGEIFPAGTIAKREAHPMLIEGIGDYISAKRAHAANAEMEQGFVKP